MTLQKLDDSYLTGFLVGCRHLPDAERSKQLWNLPVAHEHVGFFWESSGEKGKMLSGALGPAQQFRERWQLKGRSFCICGIQRGHTCEAVNDCYHCGNSHWKRYREVLIFSSIYLSKVSRFKAASLTVDISNVRGALNAGTEVWLRKDAI